MYEGTASMMNFAAERCSAPKTAKGMAKHKLVKATILSRPLARAISLFAAHSATRNNRMPAPHIETAVREISKNVARMVVCMWRPGISSRALSVPYLGGNLLLGFKNGQKYTPAPTGLFEIKTWPHHSLSQIKAATLGRSVSVRPHGTVLRESCSEVGVPKMRSRDRATTAAQSGPSSSHMLTAMQQRPTAQRRFRHTPILSA